MAITQTFQEFLAQAKANNNIPGFDWDNAEANAQINADPDAIAQFVADEKAWGNEVTEAEAADIIAIRTLTQYINDGVDSY